MRNAWKILGLKRGADRPEIRRAYARRLKETNPEDDPEGFMRLREAHDWLLSHVAEAEERKRFKAAQREGAELQWVEEVEAGSAPALEQESSDLELQEVDPDEQRLAELIQRLEQHLQSSGNEARDKSRSLMAEILSSPAIEKIAVRQATELRLAFLILDHLPLSDAIVLQAVDAFGWADQRQAERYPVSAVVDRLDEWRLIQSLETSDHPLHKAWRALSTRPNAIARWWMARTSRRQQVEELLDYAEFNAPGLRYSMDPREAQWWGDELQRPRWAIDALIWRAAGGLLLWPLLEGIGVPRIEAAAVAALLAVAFIADFLLMGLVVKRLCEPHPLPRLAAVLAAMLALPPIALVVPLSWAAAAVVILACVALAWASRLLFAEPTGVDPDRRWATAAGLGALGFLFLIADEAVPAGQFAAVAGVLWLLQTQLPLLRASAAAVLDCVTRNLTWPVLTVYAVLVCTLAWFGPSAGHVPLVRNALAVSALFAAGGIAAFSVRPIPPLLLGISIVVANLSLIIAAGAMTGEERETTGSPQEATTQGEAPGGVKRPLSTQTRVGA